MPRKVLGGRFRKRRVDVGVVVDMVQCMYNWWEIMYSRKC
jgi:hypothetical protein